VKHTGNEQPMGHLFLELGGRFTKR